jgi:hypothetical protein
MYVCVCVYGWMGVFAWCVFVRVCVCVYGWIYLRGVYVHVCMHACVRGMCNQGSQIADPIACRTQACMSCIWLRSVLRIMRMTYHFILVIPQMLNKDEMTGTETFNFSGCGMPHLSGREGESILCFFFGEGESYI